MFNDATPHLFDGMNYSSQLWSIIHSLGPNKNDQYPMCSYSSLICHQLGQVSAWPPGVSIYSFSLINQATVPV